MSITEDHHPAAPNRPPTDQLPRAQRSRVANGALHDRRVNGRTAAARRYRDAVDALCAEVGQPLAEMTESRRATLRMAAAVIVATEADQARLAQGQAVDAEQLVRQANTLSRLLDDLGLSPAALARRRAAEEQHKRSAGALEKPRVRIFITPDDVGHICSAPVEPVEAQEDVTERAPGVQFIIDDSKPDEKTRYET